MPNLSIESEELIPSIKDRLRSILNEVGILRIGRFIEPCDDDEVEPDLSIDLSIKHKKWTIVVETRFLGEPRFVRETIYKLKTIASSTGVRTYPVFAAPYLSQEAQNICRKAEVGFIDLAGNCYLKFDYVFIERLGFRNVHTERRPLRTLFSAKSSRIIRILLENANQTRGVKELAAEAETSIALVSKVKQRLFDLEFAINDRDGFRLTDPEKVLLEWAKFYNYKDNEILTCYASGEQDEVERTLNNYCKKHKIIHALTLFSGANKVAPFVRGITQTAIFVEQDIAAISRDLKMKPVTSGANVIIMRPFDRSVFWQTQNIDGLPVVSDIQLFLDLYGYKGRGEEAANFLLEQRLSKKW